MKKPIAPCLHCSNPDKLKLIEERSTCHVNECPYWAKYLEEKTAFIEQVNLERSAERAYKGYLFKSIERTERRMKNKRGKSWTIKK